MNKSKSDCIAQSQTTNFRLFQTEKLADDNLKFDKNGRKFFNRIENTVGKEDITRKMSNFSFSHSIFKRLILQTRKNQGLFGKGINVNNLSLYQRQNDRMVLIQSICR